MAVKYGEDFTGCFSRAFTRLLLKLVTDLCLFKRIGKNCLLKLSLLLPPRIYLPAYADAGWHLLFLFLFFKRYSEICKIVNILLIKRTVVKVQPH